MATFTRKDVKPGMILALRDGSRRLVREDMALVCDPSCGAKYATGPVLYLDEFCDRLLHPFPNYDIMAIWDADTGPLWWRDAHEV